jgi:hypothetical protein
MATGAQLSEINLQHRPTPPAIMNAWRPHHTHRPSPSPSPPLSRVLSIICRRRVRRSTPGASLQPDEDGLVGGNAAGLASRLRLHVTRAGADTMARVRGTQTRWAKSAGRLAGRQLPVVQRVGRSTWGHCWRLWRAVVKVGWMRRASPRRPRKRLGWCESRWSNGGRGVGVAERGRGARHGGSAGGSGGVRCTSVSPVVGLRWVGGMGHWAGARSRSSRRE